MLHAWLCFTLANLTCSPQTVALRAHSGYIHFEPNANRKCDAAPVPSPTPSPVEEEEYDEPEEVDDCPSILDLVAGADDLSALATAVDVRCRQLCTVIISLDTDI